jgi:hypothetical protein
MGEAAEHGPVDEMPEQDRRRDVEDRRRVGEPDGAQPDRHEDARAGDGEDYPVDDAGDDGLPDLFGHPVQRRVGQDGGEDEPEQRPVDEVGRPPREEVPFEAVQPGDGHPERRQLRDGDDRAHRGRGDQPGERAALPRPTGSKGGRHSRRFLPLGLPVDAHGSDTAGDLCPNRSKGHRDRVEVAHSRPSRGSIHTRRDGHTTSAESTPHQ